MFTGLRTLVAETTEKVRGLIDRLLAVRLVESSVVLAAQAFLALFPLLIVVYAIIPAGAANGLMNQLRTRVGLGSDSTAAIQHLVTDRSDLRGSISAISVIVVLGSATSFTRALQRVYQYAWGLPKLGLRGIWRTVAWLAGIVVYFTVIGGAVHFIHNDGVTKPLNIILGFSLWWWTSFLLLGGRVRWRALLPGAILTAIAQTVVTLASTIIVPREIRSNEAAYGPIGAVFAIESWFIVVAGVLVVGAALGAAMGLDEGAFGRWARGTSDPDGWRRTRRLDG